MSKRDSTETEQRVFPGTGKRQWEPPRGAELQESGTVTCTGGRMPPFAVWLSLLHCLVCWGGTAHAETEPYHTPLAGEAGEVVFLGETVSIPGVDRSNMTSITLGASLLFPQQGDTSVLPVAAFYHRRIKEQTRARCMVGVFVNELEYDQNLGAAELVTHFESNTLPVPHSELLDGAEVKGTSLYWGTLLGSMGTGWRLPVHPFQVDNDIRLQLLARVGYFYAEPDDDTAPLLWAPPDTLLYGARLRGRYDGMRRNLLELPHNGVAAGWDADYLHRDRWREQTGDSTVNGHRDFLKLSGYLVGASGVPGLSERDRLLFCLYGGQTMKSRGDRFNAFRINGATFPSEADDLPRPHYSGIIYDSLLATSYVTASAGYRREFTFFLYLTALGSYIRADRATVQGGEQVVFKGKEGAAGTVSIDSAFFWDSSLYLAYTWESGVIRNGRSGGGVTMIWNKLF